MLADLFLTSGHQYTVAATGIHMRARSFNSRQEANEFMYKQMHRHGINLEEVWDDHHDKTYVCDDGVRFYVNRNY